MTDTHTFKPGSLWRIQHSVTVPRQGDLVSDNYVILIKATSAPFFCKNGTTISRWKMTILAVDRLFVLNSLSLTTWKYFFAEVKLPTPSLQEAQ